MTNRPSSDELLTQKQYALIEHATSTRKRLDRIVSGLSVVVFETDYSGNWLYLSDSWEDLTCYKAAESLGRPFIDYVHIADRERNQALFQPLIERKKESCRHKIRYLRKDGEPVWTEVQASLLLDDFGNITGTAGTLTNIHEQQLMLETLEKNERILQASANASKLLISNQINFESLARALQVMCEALSLQSAVIFKIHSDISDTEPQDIRGLLGFTPDQNINFNSLIRRYPQLSKLLNSHASLSEVLRLSPIIISNDNNQLLVAGIRASGGLDAVVVMDSSEPWSQHDIHALNLFTQKCGLALDKNITLKQLSESERRLAFALEGSNEGVWDWNIQTGEVYFSPRWIKMLGYSPDEIEPSVSAWEKLVHPDDMNHVTLTLQEHLEGRRETYETTHRVKARDGHWLWILDRGKVVERSHDGSPIRAVGTHLDVTEKVEMKSKLSKRTAELAKANQELDTILMISPVGFLAFDSSGTSSFFTPCFQRLLEVDETILNNTPEQAMNKLATMHKLLKSKHRQIEDEFILEVTGNNKIVKLKTSKAHEFGLNPEHTLMAAIDITHEYNLDRMKGYFMSAASHELRTPLSSVCGFSELLLHGGDEFSKDERLQMLKSINDQANSLATIVAQLLDVSRIESGKALAMDLAEVNLSELISENILQHPNASCRKHSITFNSEPDCIISGDREQLIRIINNLLSNACKYSPDASEVSINIMHQKRHEYEGICFEVVDQGIGMNKKEINQAFEKFYRADKTGRVKGMGLGLSIVKELIENMNGTISISSQVGHGSTVKVWLPKNQSGVVT